MIDKDNLEGNYNMEHDKVDNGNLRMASTIWKMTKLTWMTIRRIKRRMLITRRMSRMTKRSTV